MKQAASDTAASTTISLSVVIPTLDAGHGLAATLAALSEARGAGLDLDLVVADGNSADDTRTVACAAGARVVTADPGRGCQLAAGAQAAAGDWLLFLHADTVPAPGWAGPIRAFITDPGNREHAAVFRYALNDPSPAARRLEALVAWRCRVLALPYGDQGLLLARAFYDQLGGFRPIPLMEDVDMVRRIGRRRLDVLDWPAATSAARYAQGGYVLRPLRNMVCVALFFLGLPSRWLARLYG